MPPQGDNWYIKSREPGGVALWKALLDRSNRASPEHTFGAITTVIYPKEGIVEDLRVYAEYRNRSEDRWTTLRSRVTAYQLAQYPEVECVRSEAVSEERNNPRFPGVVFTLTWDHVFCRHPFSPRHLVFVGYSERYPQTEPSRLDDALRNEVEGILRSFAFTAFPRAELPTDIRVIPPAPSVSRDRASFSGRWSGTWDNGVDHTLLVEEVRAEDAVVVVSYGVLSGPSWERLKASFRQGALVMQTPRGTTITYRLQPDGTLLATVTDRGGATSQATMARVAE